MAVAARLPIATDRVGACVRTIEFAGLDLTGAALRMQVRLAPDTPGAPLIDLQTVSAAGTEGLFLASAAMVEGVPTSVLVIRIGEQTMADMAKVPYPGEFGAASVLSYDLVGTFAGDRRRLAFGEFVTLPTTYGANNAPGVPDEARSGIPGGYSAWSAAKLKLAGDTVRITIDGAEITRGLVTRAETARDKAQAWAESTGTPGAAGTKSSKSWAIASGASATSAEAAKNLALQYRDNTIQTASTAQASFLTMGNLYQMISSGLAATAPGGYFAVAGAGEVFATVYQKVNNAAVLVNTLASQSALDHVGRFVANIANIDNAIAINAALLQPLVSGVILPPGAIRIDKRIDMPSGKFLTGAGAGVTILNRTANLNTANDGAILRTAANARGVVVRGFTANCPINNHAFDGIHMRKAFDFLVEDVAVFNASYSLWAQEFAERGVFRNCQSYNANVHCETTQAYKVIFDGVISGDGAKTNPAGCEAVWHCLLASRDITFRNCDHNGIGQTMLITANDLNGDPEGGLITRIRYENCRSIQTDDKFALFVNRYNGTVGEIDIIDCDVTSASILAQIQTGKVRMRGGQWKSTDRTGLIVYEGAALDWDNPGVSLEAAPGDGGVFFSGEGQINLRAGVLTANSPRIDIGGPNLTASPETRIIRPGADRIFTPVRGMPCRYTFPANFAASGDATIGGNADDPASGMASFRFSPVAGGQYRLRFTGRIKKTDASQYMRINLENGGNFEPGLTYGSVRMKKADGTWAADTLTNGVQIDDAALNDVRDFEMDLTFYATDNGVNVLQGTGGTMILKGAQVLIERLA